MKLYESETVELKEIYTPDLKKEIIAFANTIGGTIYIGIDNSGEIVGIDDTRTNDQCHKKRPPGE